MPNWCEGELTVKGKKLDLDNFAEAVESDRPNKTIEKEVMDRLTQKPEKDQSCLDANKIIPYPQEDGFNSGGYEWCIENWGTKWEFCNVTREIRPRSIFYTFETAWSPPKPLLVELGEKFSNLTFTYRYYESGMGFSGKLVMSGGQIVTEEFNNNYHGHRGG